MKSDPQAEIRAAFRKRRERLGLTQADMGQLLGTSRLAYSRIEGANQPTILGREIRAQIDKVLTKLESEMRRQTLP